nr:type III-B CRISPR module RAMP protein Cmr1 [Bacteroidota bacterium]
MEKLIFECETITPMFLAGADGTTPELRTPSIKGALRFWWRALHGHLPLADLKIQETEIFGGTNPAKRSAVIFNIKNHSDLLPFNLPPKEQNSGIAYLWYSNYMNNRQGFFVKNFTIEFKSNNLELLHQAGDAFWLLQNFGALGTRSRRCAGSFKLNSVTGTIDTPHLFSPITTDSLNYEQFLKRKISDLYSNYILENSSDQTDFPVFANSSVYLINNGFHDPLKAVEYIGSEFQHFRSHYQPDYSTVKNYIQKGQISETVEKAAFGLPLSYRYRSLEGYGAQINTGNKNQNRSASSLIFKIGFFDNQYYPIVTNFNSDIYLSKDKIEISSKKQKNVLIQKPDGKIKEAFLSNLNNAIKLS